MLHTILRHTPLSLLVISVIFSGVLSVAMAETGVGVNASTTVTAQTDSRATTTATSSVSVTKRAAFRERAAVLRDNSEKRKEALEAHLSERRMRISENVENRVRTVVSNLTSMLTGTIERLTLIADRTDSRAQKMAATGVNVDAAVALVAQARVELRAASAILTGELPAEVDAAVTDASPRTAFEFVKESIREAQAHIKAARKALQDAVSMLKTASTVPKGPDVHATTTATTTVR
jgi:hypothetical protein